MSQSQPHLRVLCFFVCTLFLLLCSFHLTLAKEKTSSSSSSTSSTSTKTSNSSTTTTVTPSPPPPPSINPLRLPPSPQVEVTIRTNLIDVIRVIEKDIRFVANVEFEFSWQDPRLTSITSNPDLIWLPDVDFANALKQDFFNPTSLRFENDTKTVFFTRHLVVFWGSLFDFQKFPFDDQDPHFIIRSRPGAVPPLLFQSGDIDPLRNEENYHILEWSFNDAEITITIEENAWGFLFSQYKFEFNIEREWSSYVTQNIVPACFMVFLSWAGFFLNISNIMPRLMPIIFATVALVNVNLFTASVLPRTGTFTYLEAFAVINISLVLLAIVELVSVQYMARSKLLRFAKITDHTARYAFPLVFLLVNGGVLVYFVGDTDAGTLIWFLVGFAIVATLLGIKIFFECKTTKKQT